MRGFLAVMALAALAVAATLGQSAAQTPEVVIVPSETAHQTVIVPGSPDEAVQVAARAREVGAEIARVLVLNDACPLFSGDYTQNLDDRDVRAGMSKLLSSAAVQDAFNEAMRDPAVTAKPPAMKACGELLSIVDGNVRPK